MHSLQVQPQTGEFRSSNWNRHLLWKATWRRTDSDQSKLFLVNLASESIALRVHQDDFVHNSGFTIKAFTDFLGCHESIFKLLPLGLDSCNSAKGSNILLSRL